ncbi:hypothetical protein M422DRAFT_23950 [Sphaerobolus stellatus SS14]|nr:hypothetical protein M422DRAFT_23950 [Sphaerobolus stellatus SS14]
MDHYDTAGRAKTRHYQKLASEMKKFAEGVAETSALFAKLDDDLKAMRTLAGLHAAQFMAFNNLEDNIEEVNQTAHGS